MDINLEVNMIVFWILILLLTGVLILLLTKLFGVKVYETSEKIYKDIITEEEDKKGELK